MSEQSRRAVRSGEPNRRNRTIEIASLMDTPEGRDEFGVPESLLEECPDCGLVVKTTPGSWHRCTDGEKVVSRG